MTQDFDPLEHAQQLENAGVSREQAAVHATALQAVLSQVVSVRGLDRVEDKLSSEIAHTEVRLKTEIGATEERLRAEIASTEERLRAEISSTEDRLRSEIGASEGRLRIEIVEVNGKLDMQKAKMESIVEVFNERFKSLEGKFTTLQWLFGLHFTVSLGILYRLIVAI